MVKCQVVDLPVGFGSEVGENTTGIKDQPTVYAINRLGRCEGLAEGREGEEGFVATWVYDMHILGDGRYLGGRRRLKLLPGNHDRGETQKRKLTTFDKAPTQGGMTFSVVVFAFLRDR